MTTDVFGVAVCNRACAPPQWARWARYHTAYEAGSGEETYTTYTVYPDLVAILGGYDPTFGALPGCYHLRGLPS